MLFRGHELNQEKAPGKVEREIHATVPDHHWVVRGQGSRSPGTVAL